MSATIAAASSPLSLASPVGRYQPEVLMLAPESGEESITLSLIAQVLELGLAVELDENWRLPVAPTRPLSSYKTCLFPDTARGRFDRELDAFAEAGGFVMYLKYYPTSDVPLYQMDHHVNPVEFNGRDVFTCHMAHMLLQSGAQRRNPDFIRTLQARPLRSILADYRAFLGPRFEEAISAGKWTHWKDPDCFLLHMALTAAQGFGDAAWMQEVRQILLLVARSSSALLSTEVRISSQLKNQVEGYLMLFGWVLMLAGDELDEPELTAAGIALGEFWYQHNHANDSGAAPNLKGAGGEDISFLPGLAWLARNTGKAQYLQLLERIVERIAGHLHRPDGLWSHWQDAAGRPQSVWCRAVYWPVWGISMAMEAIPPDAALFKRLQGLLYKTYEGLARYQDAQTGLWRLVVDEPFTRIESSGTCGYVLCHDRLRAKGLIDGRFGPMIDRAFEGLKPLCYRQGISAFCRGTDYVSAECYRSRPLGYAPASSFWAGVVGQRVAVMQK